MTSIHHITARKVCTAFSAYTPSIVLHGAIPVLADTVGECFDMLERGEVSEVYYDKEILANHMVERSLSHTHDLIDGPVEILLAAAFPHSGTGYANPDLYNLFSTEMVNFLASSADEYSALYKLHFPIADAAEKGPGVSAVPIHINRSLAIAAGVMYAIVALSNVARLYANWGKDGNTLSACFGCEDGDEVHAAGTSNADQDSEQPQDDGGNGAGGNPKKRSSQVFSLTNVAKHADERFKPSTTSSNAGGGSGWDGGGRGGGGGGGNALLPPLVQNTPAWVNLVAQVEEIAATQSELLRVLRRDQRTRTSKGDDSSTDRLAFSSDV